MLGRALEDVIVSIISLSSERSFFIFERKTLHAEPPHKGLYFNMYAHESQSRKASNELISQDAYDWLALFFRFFVKKVKNKLKRKRLH